MQGSHDHISKLIRETVILLCKNGIYFEQQLKVQGLIGVTADDGAVLLVHINDCVSSDGCSLANKPVNNQSSVHASAISQSCSDTNDQHEPEVCHGRKTSELSSLQYSSIKQEGETIRSANDLSEESHTTADVAASVNAGLPSAQEAEFGDCGVTYVESSSGLASVGSSYAKHETPGIWYPYSVPSATKQKEYESSPKYSVGLSNAMGSHDDTSLYVHSLGNTTGYGEAGFIHYSDTPRSQKRQPSTPNLSVSMGRKKRKMVIVLYIPVDNVCSSTEFFSFYRVKQQWGS